MIDSHLSHMAILRRVAVYGGVSGWGSALPALAHPPSAGRALHPHEYVTARRVTEELLTRSMLIRYTDGTLDVTERGFSRLADWTREDADVATSTQLAQQARLRRAGDAAPKRVLELVTTHREALGAWGRIVRLLMPDGEWASLEWPWRLRGARAAQTRESVVVAARAPVVGRATQKVVVPKDQFDVLVGEGLVRMDGDGSAAASMSIPPEAGLYGSVLWTYAHRVRLAEARAARAAASGVAS